jgi:hypothetical protein
MFFGTEQSSSSPFEDSSQSGRDQQCGAGCLPPVGGRVSELHVSCASLATKGWIHVLVELRDRTIVCPSTGE